MSKLPPGEGRPPVNEHSSSAEIQREKFIAKFRLTTKDGSSNEKDDILIEEKEFDALNQTDAERQAKEYATQHNATTQEKHSNLVLETVEQGSIVE